MAHQLSRLTVLLHLYVIQSPHLKQIKAAIAYRRETRDGPISGVLCTWVVYTLTVRIDALSNAACRLGSLRKTPAWQNLASSRFQCGLHDVCLRWNRAGKKGTMDDDDDEFWKS